MIAEKLFPQQNPAGGQLAGGPHARALGTRRPDVVRAVKTYEDYSQSPDGWNVTSTLELEDDGRFSYSEGQTDYTNASLSGGAGGTWRRGDGVIIFLAERVYPPIYFPWQEGWRMSSGGYDNRPVADWARQNIRGRVEVRPLFSSRAGRIFVYALLFSIPAGFFALGVLAFALGARDRAALLGPFVFAFLTSIPCGVIALVGAYVRRGFAKSLDAEGVRGSMGLKFPWGKLHYVDHVTKHVRAGRVSRQVKDNQLELVFEGGKVIIPPMIHDRAAVWSLINSMPAEVRDDGIPRPSPDGSRIRAREELTAFLETLDGPRSPGAR
jgi:hypothetical protein